MNALCTLVLFDAGFIDGFLIARAEKLFAAAARAAFAKFNVAGIRFSGILQLGIARGCVYNFEFIKRGTCCRVGLIAISFTLILVG